MYGKTVNAQTFMERSANHSTKGSRRGFVDVETGVCPTSFQSLAQQRDSLKRKHAALGEQRKRVKDNYSGKEEFKRLGRQMMEVQMQIGELNARIPHRQPADFNHAFMECAKTMLVTTDYQRIAEAARRRLAELSKEN